MSEPGGALSPATEVTSVDPGGTVGQGAIPAARVVTTAGELEADLVVAADGIRPGTANSPGRLTVSVQPLRCCSVISSVIAR